MGKETKLWVFNIAMLIFFIFVVFVPVKGGDTVFKICMDKIMGVIAMEDRSE